MQNGVRVENLERFQVDPAITSTVRRYRAGRISPRIISFHSITFDSSFESSKSICVLVYFAINKIRRVNFLSISFLSRIKLLLLLLLVETRDARACAAKSKSSATSSSQERLKKFVSNLENSGRPRFVRFLECFQKPYRSNPKIFS